MTAGMIARLVRRDIRCLISERIVAASIAVMLVLSVVFTFSFNLSTLLLTSFMLSTYGVNTFALEEKHRTERSTASLAVSRREIVLSRYVGVLVVTGVYIAFTAAANGLSLALGHPAARLMPVGYYALLLAAQAVLCALSFPVVFALGAAKARPVTMLLYVLPVSISVALLGVGKSDTLLSSPGSLAVTQDPLWPNPGASVVIVAGALVFLSASALFAMKVYERRDL